MDFESGDAQQFLRRFHSALVSGFQQQYRVAPLSQKNKVGRVFTPVVSERDVRQPSLLLPVMTLLG